jgi:hypothetical protein
MAIESHTPFELRQYVLDVQYPVNKQTLIEQARQNGADESIVSSLEQLPDQEFETIADVQDSLDQMRMSQSFSDEEEGEEEESDEHHQSSGGSSGSVEDVSKEEPGAL